MKQNQECERRKRIAEEKHKEWVKQKREEVNIASSGNTLVHAWVSLCKIYSVCLDIHVFSLLSKWLL